MQLKPFVTSTDEGTASFAVSFMGETVPVNPGQETVRINGVNFQIDTTGYAPAEEPSDNQTRDWPEPEEAPKPKKSRKSKK